MFRLEEGTHRFTEVFALDEPGVGGAYHDYQVVSTVEESGSREVFAGIRFQKGAVNVVGKNGLFMEDLLQICRHRLQCFQDGEFACRENELALTKIEEALHWLNHRTADRQRRQVEGTELK